MTDPALYAIMDTHTDQRKQINIKLKGTIMSRYSTVHCHHCWQRGHNVVTCQKLTEQVKQDPGGYYHRKHYRLFDEHGNRVKNSKKNNKCSYCKEEGHTKRTCDTRLGDMAYNVKTNAEYRTEVYKWFQEKKLGIGSLVEIYDNLYLVTDVHWDDFTCGSSHGKSLSIQPVNGLGYYRSYKIDDTEMTKCQRYSWQKVLKVEAESDAIPKPKDEWFTGRDPFYMEYTGKVTNPFYS